MQGPFLLNRMFQAWKSHQNHELVVLVVDQLRRIQNQSSQHSSMEHVNVPKVPPQTQSSWQLMALVFRESNIFLDVASGMVVMLQWAVLRSCTYWKHQLDSCISEETMRLAAQHGGRFCGVFVERRGGQEKNNLYAFMKSSTNKVV